jgi:predicted RNase H-related nuclease YkuK (DUF458 family)
MDRYWETEERELINVVEHTLQQIEKWPNLKMYIGTDSQDFHKFSRFATAICYRYGHRGAHYVFYLEDVPRMKSMEERLLDEASRTIESAEMITAEIPIAFEALEFDYNHLPRFKSNKVLSTVRGWVAGMNYTPVFKSGQLLACKAADHIVRNKEPRKNG